jgi:hypothetical protein
MDILDLQRIFINELLKGVESPWDRLEVHYEYFVWEGDAIVNYTSEAIEGQNARELELSLEASTILRALHDCKPEGQAEPWTWLEFSLDKSGAYKFDYKYGVPPLAAEEIKYPDA